MLKITRLASLLAVVAITGLTAACSDNNVSGPQSVARFNGGDSTIIVEPGDEPGNPPGEPPAGCDWEYSFDLKTWGLVCN